MLLITTAFILAFLQSNHLKIAVTSAVYIKRITLSSICVHRGTGVSPVLPNRVKKSERPQKERSPSQTNYPSSSDFTGGRPEITINPTDSRVMCGRRIPAKTASLNKLSVLISSAKTDSKSCSDLESRCKRNCN